MKALALCLGLSVAAVLPVCAQVTVELTQDQDQFLPSEALTTAVRITNRSGQALRLGREPDWLTFSVQSHSVDVVPKIAEVPVQGEFVLEPSRVATKRVDLAPCFSIGNSGRYSIVATVRIKEWNLEVSSSPKSFDIVRGATLWEQEIGVPTSTDSTNATPEVRKFMLEQASYLKSQLRLYLRVTDGSGARTFRVIAIGPMVSFSRPEPQLDKFSNLHLLYQDGGHSFRYTVVNPDGVIIVRQIYDYVDKRPRLQPDHGKIIVVGGVRRLSTLDVPSSQPTAPAEDVRKPLPSPGEPMLPPL